MVVARGRRETARHPVREVVRTALPWVIRRPQLIAEDLDILRWLYPRLPPHIADLLCLALGRVVKPPERRGQRRAPLNVRFVEDEGERALVTALVGGDRTEAGPRHNL